MVVSLSWFSCRPSFSHRSLRSAENFTANLNRPSVCWLTNWIADGKWFLGDLLTESGFRRLSQWTFPNAGISCVEMWRCLSRYLVPDVSRQPVVSFSGVVKAHLQTPNQKGSCNCFCLNLPIYHPKLIAHILRNWSHLIIRKFLQNIERI